MVEFKFFRVGSMPAQPEANALYLIRDEITGKLNFCATSSTGAVVPSLTQQGVMDLITANIPDAAEKLTTARSITIGGDASWTVSFDGSENVTGNLTLAETGVTAGEYQVVTVDAKGRVTAARALVQADIPSLDGSKIISDISVNTSGNAATATLAAAATKLATAVTINGVEFDGSAPIVINAEDSVARIAVSEKGALNGVAPLNADGLIDAQYLPSYVDDVVEVDNFDKLPGLLSDPSGIPEKGKIYVVANEASSKIYRWSGSTYIEIPSGVGTADAAVKLATARSIAIGGDATWTVNFDGSDDVYSVLTLADSGVVAGTYAGITFDSKGRAVSARALIEDDMPMLTSAKVLSAQSVTVSGDWA